MSGWENIPDEAPKQPRAPRKRGPAAVEASAPSADEALVEDGEFARLVDLYWPQIRLMMLAIVSLIGVWAAIGKLPNHPSWLP